MAIAAASTEPMTGLSSLDRPAGWIGDWVKLPRDDESQDARDARAQDRLHWVPLHDSGLRHRMATLAAWIERAKPSVMVTDVSVEIALLARLHGVPVVTFVLPGERGDEAHALGYDIASVILAAWPSSISGMVSGLTTSAVAKVRNVGAISRFPVASLSPRRSQRARVVVLSGKGGSSISARQLAEASRQATEWEWIALGESNWVDDPWPVILSADVIVTHAGESAIAEVSAARKAAIVIPQSRPHSEQLSTARALRSAGGWPTIVRDKFESHDWNEVLGSAAELDGSLWAGWNDGSGAARAAGCIAEVGATSRLP